MKKLYARLVLWLIRPALELHAEQSGVLDVGTLCDETLKDELIRRGFVRPDFEEADSRGD